MILRLLVIASFLGATPTYAEPLTLDIATIIPDGTGAATELKEWSKTVATTTHGDVKFRFMWGGLAGDDANVLKQIRDGKLGGGLFAGQVLSAIAPSLRETERLFKFDSDRDKAWKFAQGLDKTTTKELEKNGFQGLGIYEAGFVYLVGTKPFKKMSDLKGAKIWSWPGDTLGHKSIATLGGTPVDVPVQDTLTALSSGNVDVVYGPPIAIVALQWMSKAKYMLEQPIAYAAGTFAVSQSAWKKIKLEHQRSIASQTKAALDKLTQSTISDNSEALALLKASGLQQVRFTPAEITSARGQ